MFSLDDFAFTELPLNPRVSDDISCYECLGQMVLLFLLARIPGARNMSIRMPSWCDNTGAEAVTNSLFATSWPLAAFAQRLSLLSGFTNIALDVSHIAGPKNVDADFLSRWDGCAHLPQQWAQNCRVRFSLHELWFSSAARDFFPKDLHLPCKLPRLSPLGAAL